MLFFLNTYIPTILYKIFSIYIMPEHDDSDTESETDNDERENAVNASETELDTDNEGEELDPQTPYDGRSHGQSHEQGGLTNNRHLQHITHIDPENKESDGYQQSYQEHLKNDYGGENLINDINNERGNKRRFDENVPQRMMDNAARETGNPLKVIPRNPRNSQKAINKRQRLKEGGKKSRKKRRKTKKGKSKRRKGKTRSKRRNQKKRRKTKKKKKNNTK